MPATQEFQTFVYKTVESHANEKVDILLDVYLPQSYKARGKPLTPLIWIHTGGFLQGTRKFLPEHFLRSCNSLNMVFVSPDFRLAPQVNITDILEDISDAIRFVMNGQLAALANIDISAPHYVLAGSSAGGWAALLIGLGLWSSSRLPKITVPIALLTLYPITTVARERAPYFYKPLKPLPWGFCSAAEKGDIVPAMPLQEYMDVKAPPAIMATPMEEPVRSTLYSYSRQEGIYPELIFGKPIEDQTSAYRFCVPTQIYAQLSCIESCASLPKLIFVSCGDEDVMVEPDQTDQVVEALRKIKSTSTATIAQIEKGKGHIWDIIDSKADIPLMWELLEKVLISNKG